MLESVASIITVLGFAGAFIFFHFGEKAELRPNNNMFEMLDKARAERMANHEKFMERLNRNHAQTTTGWKGIYRGKV